MYTYSVLGAEEQMKSDLFCTRFGRIDLPATFHDIPTAFRGWSQRGVRSFPYTQHRKYVLIVLILGISLRGQVQQALSAHPSGGLSEAWVFVQESDSHPYVHAPFPFLSFLHTRFHIGSNMLYTRCRSCL